MKVHYNLIDERWVPCILMDGTQKNLSLRDTLLNSHKIREIHAELPPMTASLLMLLLGVLYRSLANETEDDWIDCWESGVFDRNTINTYLDHWHHRFDLFDIAYPFYQDPLIGKRPKDIKGLKGKYIEPKSINGLILHSSSGDAATLFDHSTDGNPGSFTAEQMARLLLMFQGFSLGGMTSASISEDKYYKDAPHCRGVVTFTRGESLFQTLLLNTVPREELREILQNNSKDMPAWEMDDPFADGREVPRGITDFLTWQSRRILLRPINNQGVLSIQELYAAPGLSIAEEFNNPLYSYVIKEGSGGKQERKLLRFSESRALWRDSISLLHKFDSKNITPQVIEWANFLSRNEIIKDHIFLLVYGQCSQPGKKKAYFYREENFTYPLVYLSNNDLRYALERQLIAAGEVRSQLWGALSQMAGLILAQEADLKEGRKADPKDIQNLITHWDSEGVFWKTLEHPFYKLVNSLPEDNHTAIADWQNNLRQAAQAALDMAIRFAGNDVKAMKASSKARRQLVSGIRKVLIPLDKEEV